MHALLPYLPQPESLAAIYKNAETLEEIAKVLTYEYRRSGIIADMIPLTTEMPSDFFYGITHQLRHGDPVPTFLGGLMSTKEKDLKHVIAITAIHEGKKPKASIVDTYPHVDHRSFCKRRVPLEWLDRRITHNEEDGSRAIALLGVSLDQYEKEFHYLPTSLFDAQADFEMIYRETLIKRSEEENT